jgi:hypothetical protein
MPSLSRHSEPKAAPHPIHDQIFGDDDDLAPEVDDTPPGAIRGNVNLGGIAAAPEKFEPMRSVGDTDQGDRQPDGRRRR